MPIIIGDAEKPRDFPNKKNIVIIIQIKCMNENTIELKNDN